MGMSKPRKRTWREAELKERMRTGLPWSRDDYVVFQEAVRRSGKIETIAVTASVGDYLVILKGRGRA